MAANTSVLEASGASGFDTAALSGIFSLPPAQLTLLASVLGLLFLDGLDLAQQNAIGNFLVSIGQTVLTAAAQGELIKENTDPTTLLQRQIQALQKQVAMLEKKVTRDTSPARRP
jgi:hypothetical protein